MVMVVVMVVVFALAAVDYGCCGGVNGGCCSCGGVMVAAEVMA